MAHRHIIAFSQEEIESLIRNTNEYLNELAQNGTTNIERAKKWDEIGNRMEREGFTKRSKNTLRKYYTKFKSVTATKSTSSSSATATKSTSSSANLKRSQPQPSAIKKPKKVVVFYTIEEVNDLMKFAHQYDNDYLKENRNKNVKLSKWDYVKQKLDATGLYQQRSTMNLYSRYKYQLSKEEIKKESKKINFSLEEEIYIKKLKETKIANSSFSSVLSPLNNEIAYKTMSWKEISGKINEKFGTNRRSEVVQNHYSSKLQSMTIDELEKMQSNKPNVLTETDYKTMMYINHISILGTMSQQEIKKYQKTTDLLIKKEPFQRLVREIAQSIISEIRFKAIALHAPQSKLNHI